MEGSLSLMSYMISLILFSRFDCHFPCVHRFLSKGGVLILTTWLSQAAMEEQTSVLLLILKVQD